MQIKNQKELELLKFFNDRKKPFHMLKNYHYFERMLSMMIFLKNEYF